MSSFWSRILVAAVGLPAVLGLVWLGGWWLWVLAAGAGLIALHEFYGIARPLRPLVLAGYAGLLLLLLGAQLGGTIWMLGGFGHVPFPGRSVGAKTVRFNPRVHEVGPTLAVSAM